jgi:hypothetical protein
MRALGASTAPGCRYVVLATATTANKFALRSSSKMSMDIDLLAGIKKVTGREATTPCT